MTIGMSRTEPIASRSPSPLMIRSAPPLTASSREFVIGRIPAKRQTLGNRDHKAATESGARRREIAARSGREARALKDVIKFLFRGGAFEDPPSSDQPDRVAGPGGFLQRGADKDIGVDNQPHPF